MTGGNCEITPSGTTEKHGATICGIKNILNWPTSSTHMFAHNVYNFVKNITKEGEIVLDRSDEIVSSSLVTYQNEIVHAGTREAMNI